MLQIFLNINYVLTNVGQLLKIRTINPKWLLGRCLIFITMVFLKSYNLPQKFLFLYISFHENHQFLFIFQIIRTNGSLIMKVFKKLKPIFFDFEIFDKTQLWTNCFKLFESDRFYSNFNISHNVALKIIKLPPINPNCWRFSNIMKNKPQFLKNHKIWLDWLSLKTLFNIQ